MNKVKVTLTAEIYKYKYSSGSSSYNQYKGTSILEANSAGTALNECTETNLDGALPLENSLAQARMMLVHELNKLIEGEYDHPIVPTTDYIKSYVKIELEPTDSEPLEPMVVELYDKETCRAALTLIDLILPQTMKRLDEKQQELYFSNKTTDACNKVEQTDQNDVANNAQKSSKVSDAYNQIYNTMKRLVSRM